MLNGGHCVGAEEASRTEINDRQKDFSRERSPPICEAARMFLG